MLARGAVGLLGAHFGRLQCVGARLNNDTGPALYANNMRVYGSVHLLAEFEAIGASGMGTIRVVSGHIGNLEGEGARLRNDAGPALNADDLRVDRSVHLRYGFQAIGASGHHRKFARGLDGPASR